MSKVLINWLHDHHDCETCGGSYAEGAEVYINDALVITLEPLAHCFNGIDYGPDKVYRAILEHLGHTVEEDTDDED